MWKLTGRRVYETADGYRLVYLPEHPAARHGVVALHRAVLENALGRRLRAGEVVHHKDGDKANNALSNLAFTTLAEHSRAHAKERPKRGESLVSLVCPECGVTFKRVARNANRKQRQYCSLSCSGLHAARERQAGEALVHGTHKSYRRGCRCAVCRASNAEKARRYKASLRMSVG